jgi:hypothetical protein
MDGLLSLLPEDQRQAIEGRARSQGLLNLGLALMQSAESAPGQRRPSLMTALGRAAPSAVQGYQGGIDQALREILISQQMQEMQQKRRREQAIQRALQLGTPQEQVNALRGLGAYDVLGQMATAEKGIRQSGMLRQPGEMAMENPFSIYAQSEVPVVAKLGKQYQKAYESGSIDDEKATARLGELARMEESAFARQESAADRKLSRELAQGEREQKREEGTESQKLAAGFADRMVFSNAVIDQLEGAGGLPTEYTGLAGGVPFVGGYLQRKAMTPEQQRYKQAADNWIRANLRKESGAAIPPEEMALEYETYFPLPGDDPDTIAQKAENRKITTEAMIKNAGPVFRQPITSRPRPADVKAKYGLENSR